MATADIAILVQRLIPEAKYGNASTYVALQATWRDAADIPTEAELEAVRTEVESALDDLDANPSDLEIILAVQNAESDPATLTDVNNRRAASDAAKTLLNL